MTGENITEEILLELLIDHDIQDIASEGFHFTIYCDPIAIDDIKNILQNKNISLESADIEWTAQNLISLSKEEEEKAYELLQALEDLDDVQNVYTNLG